MLVLLTALSLLCLPALAIEVGSDTAAIYVTSSPSGATATDSGTGNTITTPGTFTIYTTGTPVDHYITVSKAGYYDYHYNAGYVFTVGDYVTVNAILIPIPTNGYLYISSNPSGAIVYVDGVYKGVSPTTVTLSPGSHSVQMSMSGYNTWSGSTTVNAGQTTQVSATLDPSVTYGYLSVSSSPSNADVYINGVYKGDTSFTIGLNPGTYQVTVKKSGYTSYTTTATVNTGMTTSVSASLQPNANAYVQIASYPSGAAVYIDGSYVGNTQYSTVSNPNYLNAGPFTPGTSHTLLFTLDNYNPYSTSFILSSGETRTISATLVPVTPVITTATLQISSDPSGAEVYVDNAFRGYTPLNLNDITAGTHTIFLQNTGYDDWSQSISFTAGQTVERTVVMSSTVVPTPTSTPVPFIGILAGLGACGVVMALRRR
ncbi:PEGA domain-containing protein [uncultured Methanocorpusculum sp.]|nr:PEGA domain-containing protein [uncultured Methanocorpusculum sp.]